MWTNLNSAEINGSEMPHWGGIEVQKELEDICHENEIKPLRRQLCDANNMQEEDEMRDRCLYIQGAKEIVKKWG